MIKIRRQKPVKGGRKPLHPCVLKEIDNKIRQLAREHRVSRSFVVASILGKALGVRIQENYYE